MKNNNKQNYSEKKHKRLKTFLDIAICLVSIIIVFVAFGFLSLHNEQTRPYSEYKLLDSMNEKKYGYCIKYCYYNEMLNANINEDAKQCSNTIKYFETTYMSRVYRDCNDEKHYIENEKLRNLASENMGDYAILKQTYDNIFNNK